MPLQHYLHVLFAWKHQNELPAASDGPSMVCECLQVLVHASHLPSGALDKIQAALQEAGVQVSTSLGYQREQSAGAHQQIQFVLEGVYCWAAMLQG